MGCMYRPTLTAQLVSASFGWDTVSRARILCKQGAVLNWGFDIARTKILGAIQQENRQNSYRVEVYLSDRTDPGDTYLFGQCTCPAERDCVHAAAVALMAVEDLQGSGDDLQLVLTPPVESDEPSRKDAQLSSFTSAWLQRLTVSLPGTRHDEPEERIIYVLNADRRLGNPLLQVEPHIIRQLKSGDFGAKRPYNWQQLACGQARFIKEIDRSIARLWVACSSKDNKVSPGRPLLPPEDAEVMDLLLSRIIATGRAHWEDNLACPLTKGPAEDGKIEWMLHKDVHQSPQVVLCQTAPALEILHGSSPWYIDVSSRQAGMISLPFSRDTVQALLSAPRIRPAEAASIQAKLKEISADLPLPQLKVKEEVRTNPPVPCLHLKFQKFKNRVLVSEGTQEAFLDGANVAIVSFDYGFDTSKLANSWQSYRWLDGKRSIVTQRDKPFEDAVFARLSQTGLQRSGYLPLPPTQSCLMARTNSQQTWLTFVQESLPPLKQEGWRIITEDSFGFKVVESNSDWLAQIDENAGWWFSLDLGIDVDGLRVPLLPVLTEALCAASTGSPLSSIDQLNKHGKFYAHLTNGQLIALPFARVRGILSCLMELLDQPNLSHSGRLSISIPHVMALMQSDHTDNLQWQGAESLRRLAQQMGSFDICRQIDEPDGFLASLRPYQKEGMSWLEFISTFKLGGLLADDMGLGKTVQTLAHIAREKQEGRLDLPCLVVCPTSVVPNWQAEARRYTPDLSVLSLHGSDRDSRFAQAQKADLVLSTYGLLVRNAAALAAIKWHAVILDEAQAIKNSDTKAAQAALQLESKYRLALTGTPIQNHLGELWSQFNFLMPGLLGDKRTFDRVFRAPIERDADSERLMLLSSRIKPFMIRRTKEQVAQDLPSKTEMIRYVELEGAQRDLYETVRLAMHQQVLSEVKTRGLASCQLIILDALLKLRQVCCDPRLVKLPAAQGITESAKLDCLKSMLEELIEEGRQILLFSQFTSMLDFIATDLRKQGIPYVELRGDTSDRETPVKRFQNGEVQLFLISLKAGGTGLNLTAADTVIHYDPWWNPAVEDQATDRAHRIGQDKPVFVYRLLSSGTIEQRMLELQEQKRAVAASILGGMGGAHDSLAHFNEADLAAMFAPLPAASAIESVTAGDEAIFETVPPEQH